MKPLWEEMAVVGRIARAHGHRGEVIINLETDFPEERFRPGAVLFWARNGRVAEVGLTAVRFHQGRPVVRIQGVDSMNDAEKLAGLELRVPRSVLRELPEGLFYHHDLVGCRIITVEGEEVGIVTAVEGSVGGSHLVASGGRGEVLIPLAADICVAINPVARTIVVDPPEGLLEVNSGTIRRDDAGLE